MKTPIQEAIDKVQSLKEIDAVINPIDVITTILKQMLEKEKEVMCEFAEFIAEDHWRLHNVDYQINLYEWKHADGDVKTTNELFETFKTKEK